MAHKEPLEAHPVPPEDFNDRELPTTTSGGPWYRLFSVERDPLYFTRSGRGRFDGPDLGYGIGYVGEDEYCAFIECYGRAHGAKGVEEAALQQRELARIVSQRPLVLVDLLGNGLVKLGADARLSSGPYLVSRQWARAIWTHPSRVDGIRYRSRHDNTRICCGLFDRAAQELGIERLGTLPDCHRQLLAEILAHYDYGLL
jgi:hypothetical protein